MITIDYHTFLLITIADDDGWLSTILIQSLRAFRRATLTSSPCSHNTCVWSGTKHPKWVQEDTKMSSGRHQNEFRKTINEFRKTTFGLPELIWSSFWASMGKNCKKSMWLSPFWWKRGGPGAPRGATVLEATAEQIRKSVRKRGILVKKCGKVRKTGNPKKVIKSEGKRKIVKRQGILEKNMKKLEKLGTTRKN